MKLFISIFKDILCSHNSCNAEEEKLSWANFLPKWTKFWVVAKNLTVFSDGTRLYFLKLKVIRIRCDVTIRSHQVLQFRFGPNYSQHPKDIPYYLNFIKYFVYYNKKNSKINLKKFNNYTLLLNSNPSLILNSN